MKTITFLAALLMGLLSINMYSQPKLKTMENNIMYDELQIRKLITRYCITTDNADVDGFMNCWVDAEDFEGYDSGPFGFIKTW